MSQALHAIVGDSGFVDGDDIPVNHLSEWRGHYTGRAAAMLKPATTEEVSAVLQYCNQQIIGVVPQGGNTGLCGGAIPDPSGEQILLNMSRMNRFRSIDPADFSMIAEAGCTLADVQAEALAADRLFPLSLSAEGSCQIGGNLSTDAGGINVLRYGTAREQVLGLEVVLADGRVLEGLRRLRKDTAGYDLKHMFIGAEGTLGVITAAALRLHPCSRDTLTVLVAIENLSDSVALLGELRAAMGDELNAFELISRAALQCVLDHIPDSIDPFSDHYPAYVLMDFGVLDEARSRALLEEALARTLDRGVIRNALFANTLEQARRLWRMRHAMSEAQKFLGRSLKHDISVPVGAVGAFCEKAQSVLSQQCQGLRIIAFGHVGDGNLHYNLSPPESISGEEFDRLAASLTEGVYDLVIGFGGSVSAEHGIGVAKRAALRGSRSDTELDIMRSLKKTLDPNGIMNPGKVL